MAIESIHTRTWIIEFGAYGTELVLSRRLERISRGVFVVATVGGCDGFERRSRRVLRRQFEVESLTR